MEPTGARGGLLLNRAFSLLETVFAGLILGLVVFAVVGLYPGVLRGLRLGHDRVGASNLAQQLLEEARVTPWESLKPQTGSRTIDGVDYAYKLEIGPSPDGTARVRLVTARVRWANQDLTLSTRLYHFQNP